MSTYDPLTPVTGGLSGLTEFCEDRSWGILFTRLEILAQEKAIVDARVAPEAERAANSMLYLMSLIVPLFPSGEVPEVVHQLISARARQVSAERTT